jgi:DNA replication licensing factor MCM6
MQISYETELVMIAEYKNLRLRESANKSAWRITVRQLESMIRLSEAIARMYLLEEVEPKRVKEAFRLLSKSIIRVEQPDIRLDDDALEAEIEAVSRGPTETLGGGADQQQMDVDVDGGVDASQKTIKLTYDEYKRISNMLVYYIRMKKEEIDTESNGTSCLRSYQHTDGDSLVKNILFSKAKR